ncbi:hypothetical protein G6F57_023588 [Rhizopus arrhizus]|nr:hypothetical protein G6F57_023588 [Rhizopus arrhizus]
MRCSRSLQNRMGTSPPGPFRCGVAAALQHAHRDLRGQPVRGRHDPEGAADFWTGGERVAHLTVTGGKGKWMEV